MSNVILHEKLIRMARTGRLDKGAEAPAKAPAPAGVEEPLAAPSVFDVLKIDNAEKAPAPAPAGGETPLAAPSTL